jgi:hypothetical protein
VLGGVGALGPIGIFVGPIAVAFLQAALSMLQLEIDSLSGGGLAGAEAASWAGKPGRWPQDAPSADGGVAREGDGKVKS